MFEPKTKTGIVVGILLVMTFIIFVISMFLLWTIKEAHAELPISYPQSPDEAVEETNADGTIRAAVWRQADGSLFCMAGNPNNLIKPPPPVQPGDTFLSYISKVIPFYATRELTQPEWDFCNTLFAKLPSDQWVVTENYYRGELRPDRPVYKFTDVFPSVKVKLTDLDGDVRAPHGEPCGDFVANYGNTTDYQWRKYKDGVTACRKVGG